MRGGMTGCVRTGQVDMRELVRQRQRRRWRPPQRCASHLVCRSRPSLARLPSPAPPPCSLPSSLPPCPPPSLPSCLPPLPPLPHSMKRSLQIASDNIEQQRKTSFVVRIWKSNRLLWMVFDALSGSGVGSLRGHPMQNPTQNPIRIFPLDSS